RECLHNVNYWTFGDYLGVGAGAHGKISDTARAAIFRTTKVKLPRGYLARAARRADFGNCAAVAADQLPFEFMLNALRLGRGVSLADFTQRTGLPLSTIAAPLADACARGWLHEKFDRLQPTALGQRFLNDLIGLFLPA
ncbi:MAG: oxygen-independent coproporphyrinogen III oxidase-like protein, partial [Rhodanobacteraceae bacterium]